MNAVASIDSTLELYNKYSSALENNIAIFERYTKKVKEGYKIIDKGKKSYNNMSKFFKSDNLKKMMKNPMDGLSNKIKGMFGGNSKGPDNGSRPQKTKQKKKKWSMPNIPGAITKATGLIKKFWETPIGKNIKLGIMKDEKFSGMVNQIKEKWNNTWVSMGGKIAKAIQPVLEKVLSFMDSEGFTNMLDLIIQIIEKIVGGVMVLLDYLAPIMDIVNQILSFIVDNSEVVLVVLGGIAAAILAIVAATAAYNAICSIRIIKEKILKAILQTNPTLLIVQAIILLIMIFITLIATIEPVRKAVADLTRCFFDFIEWGINNLVEGLASAAEGIIRFAGDGINAFLNVFVNPFIDGINLIIDGLNLLGANINKLDHLQVDFSGAAEATGNFIRKGKVDLSAAKEAVAGAIENFSAEALKDKLGIGALEDKANKQTDNKDVGVQVNKINDDVDIADEDVKLMRDVAEREMVQNFVTLTPTVSMGDMTVNENADADQLLGKITEALVTEVANSAQGVYA